MTDDRQLAIPGVPAPPPAPAARSVFRTRAVHFQANVKAERRQVRVTVDAGMVTFRTKGSHRPLQLDFNTWAGLGYWHAAKLAAEELKAERKRRRRLARLGGAK